MSSALAWQRAHGQSVLPIDGLQGISAHGVSDQLELLCQRLTAVGHADVWDVGPANVVALGTFLVIGGTQPVALDLEVEEEAVRAVPHTDYEPGPDSASPPLHQHEA